MSDVGKARVVASGARERAAASRHRTRWHGDPPGDAAAARSKLLDAAEASFARIGVSRTTMDDIATAAGVHRTTVYEYFPNRDVLLADVFAREAAEVIRLAGRHIREQPTFPEGLVRAIADGIELTRASTQLGRLLEPATAGHTMHAALASEAWAEQVRTALAAPVRRAIDRGEVRDDAPLDDLLSWIVRVALSVTAEPPAPSTGDIGDILRLFLLPAIAPR